MMVLQVREHRLRLRGSLAPFVSVDQINVFYSEFIIYYYYLLFYSFTMENKMLIQRLSTSVNGVNES